jgi:hypothetical protein
VGLHLSRAGRGRGEEQDLRSWSNLRTTNQILHAPARHGVHGRGQDTRRSWSNLRTTNQLLPTPDWDGAAAQPGGPGHCGTDARMPAIMPTGGKVRRKWCARSPWGGFRSPPERKNVERALGHASGGAPARARDRAELVSPVSPREQGCRAWPGMAACDARAAGLVCARGTLVHTLRSCSARDGALMMSCGTAGSRAGGASRR